MKKDKDNEVYFIGAKKEIKFRRNIIAAIVIFIIIAVASGIIFYQDRHVVPSHMLETVDVLPKNAKSPLFDGRYDMTAFIMWIKNNLKYPKGYEEQNAKVVVSFVIKEDGYIGDIKVISAPKNPIFQRTVISLLKKCPRWKPAEQSDGRAINIRYTLPVAFKGGQ
ncbi:MAG TPA: TonB family protein [Xylanibacter oryzae]|nr:TonB family protein [Xylanibacter oryzae]